MKVLLDIKEDKATFLIEILNNLPFVKVKLLSAEKAQILEEIREAVEEMTLIKVGKLEARNAEDFLNEF